MAPGGVVSGLDNLGAAVMRAMNARAERGYARDRESRQRANQLEDQATARGQQVSDRNQQELSHAASSYGPDMETAGPGGGMFSDIDAAEAQGQIAGTVAEALRQRRRGAKGAYGLADQKIPAAKALPPARVPAAHTFANALDPAGGRQLDVEGRIADLEATAAAAEAAGHDDQAAQLRASAQSLVQIKGLGPAPTDDTPSKLRAMKFGEFFSSPEYQGLHVPAPQNPAHNSADVFNFDPTQDKSAGAITYKDRADSHWYSADEPDQNYFQEDPTRIAGVQGALDAYRSRQRQAGRAAYAPKRQAYDQQRLKLMAGTDPGTAVALRGSPGPADDISNELPDTPEVDPAVSQARVQNIRSRLQAAGLDHSKYDDATLLAKYGMTDNPQ